MTLSNCRYANSVGFRLDVQLNMCKVTVDVYSKFKALCLSVESVSAVQRDTA